MLADLLNPNAATSKILFWLKTHKNQLLVTSPRVNSKLIRQFFAYTTNHDSSKSYKSDKPKTKTKKALYYTKQKNYHKFWWGLGVRGDWAAGWRFRERQHRVAWSPTRWAGPASLVSPIGLRLAVRLACPALRGPFVPLRLQIALAA